MSASMTVEGIEEIVVEAGNEVKLPECSPVATKKQVMRWSSGCGMLTSQRYTVKVNSETSLSC